MKTLYIIGNGFDIHHHIDTKYPLFLSYLKNCDYIGSQIYYYLESCFTGNLWNDFEESLGEFNIEYFISDNVHLLDENSDKMSDRFRLPDYSETIKKYLVTGLRNRFSKWILQIQKPSDIAKYKIKLEDDAYYLTFNYTDTLEKYYNISKRNILHIHGIAEPYYDIRHMDDPTRGEEEEETDIILGHSPVKIKPIKNIAKGFAAMSVDDTIDILKDYFKETTKLTKNIIIENQYFFNNKFLSQFQNIIILGHSLSNVDINYFIEISHYMNSNIVYDISYHNNNELNKIKTQSKKFINNGNVNYFNF